MAAGLPTVPDGHLMAFDGDLLTRKIGPLPGWQWAALVGGLGGVAWYVIRGRNAATSTAGAAGAAGSGGIDPATGLPYSNAYGPGMGGEVLAPIVIQNGPNTPAPPPKPTAKPATGYAWTLVDNKWRQVRYANQDQAKHPNLPLLPGYHWELVGGRWRQVRFAVENKKPIAKATPIVRKAPVAPAAKVA